MGDSKVSYRVVEAFECSYCDELFRSWEAKQKHEQFHSLVKEVFATAFETELTILKNILAHQTQEKEKLRMENKKLVAETKCKSERIHKLQKRNSELEENIKATKGKFDTLTSELERILTVKKFAVREFDRTGKEEEFQRKVDLISTEKTPAENLILNVAEDSKTSDVKYSHENKIINPKAKPFSSSRRRKLKLRVKRNKNEWPRYHYPKNLKCSQCEKSFSFQSILTNHFKRVHEKVLNYNVEITINNPAATINKTEMIENEKNGENPLNSISMVDNTLQKIRRNAQKEERHHQCRQCNKSYGSSDHLMRHVKSVHEKIRFSCKNCEKSFHSKSNLLRHVKSNHEKIGYSCKKSEKRLFQCSNCQKTFPTKTNLFRHLNSIHDKIRYNCESCEKSFSEKSKLNQHKLKTHAK